VGRTPNERIRQAAPAPADEPNDIQTGDEVATTFACPSVVAPAPLHAGEAWGDSKRRASQYATRSITDR